MVEGRTFLYMWRCLSSFDCGVVVVESVCLGDGPGDSIAYIVAVPWLRRKN